MFYESIIPAWTENDTEKVLDRLEGVPVQ